MVLDSVYLVFNPSPTTPTYLVIENPNPSAISILDTSLIKSENEINKIRWSHVGIGGNYIIPFGTSSNVYIPLSLNIPSGNGSLVYSTYGYGNIPMINAWNNYLYMPSDVTHMNNYFSGSLNNSNNVIDRFWIIDPKDNSEWEYSGSGNLDINFTYDPNEITPGNIIIPSSLLAAQRFNSDTDQWGDYLPISICSIPNVTTSIPMSQMYRSWTLSSQMIPLPVEFMGFWYECDNDKTILRWNVVSENDIDHYLVERSIDAEDWSIVGQVGGSGNHHGEINYFLEDEIGQFYYRLSSFDIDGTQRQLSSIYSICGGNNIQIVNGYLSNNSIGIIVRSSKITNLKLRIIDAGGRIISDVKAPIAIGITNLIGYEGYLSRGMYSLNLYDDNISLFVKVVNL